MNRKPHPPIHPTRQTVTLALAILLVSGAAPALRAQAQAKVDPATKAAVPVKPAQIPAEPATMTLRSVSGQEIEAKLLSVTGDMVSIERIDDGKEFLVPISSFDEYTGGRVRQWMERAPGAVDYSFTVDATKNLVDATTFMSGGRDLKTAEWSYRVKVTNLSRNELIGAKLEYRIIFDDEVDIARSVVSPGKGANQQDGQLLDLPAMLYNDEVEFDTPPLVLHTYEYVPQRGEREFSRDAIKGIWVRIVKLDEVLHEYQSHPGAMASLSWDNEDEVEIRFTNRFREQFDAGAK